LVTTARAKRAEHEWMQKLYELRMHPISPPHEMDRRYADAFKEIGLDIDATSPEKIGQFVRKRGGATAELLILALDDWTMRFKPGGPDRPSRRPGPAEEAEDRPPSRRPWPQ